MALAAQITAVAAGIVFLFVAAITIGPLWMHHKTRLRALDVLKSYADRGEEPPASVLDTVNQFAKTPGPPPPRVPTRAEHLSHFAASVVLAIGAGCVIWWRAQLPDPGPLMIVGIIVAIFFAGSPAARLVAAVTTRDGQ